MSVEKLAAELRLGTHLPYFPRSLPCNLTTRMTRDQTIQHWYHICLEQRADRIALNSSHCRQAHQTTPVSFITSPRSFEKISCLPAFMSLNQNRKGTISSNAGSMAVIANAVAKAIEKRLPSSQEKQGDNKLNQARDLATVVEEDDIIDISIIEQQISHAENVKVGLDTKSGCRKYFHAREYHRAADGVYQHVKSISDRVYDRLRFQSQPGTSSEADNICRTAHWHWQARSLYRCWLSCKDAFPPSLMQEEWVNDVWEEVCCRTEVHPSLNLLRQDDEFKCSSMKLLKDIKKKTKPVVESLYEFETGQAPQSISHNASRAQALLAETTFIYQEFNFGGEPRYPYRHPIIQKVINITWFWNKVDIGIVFHEYFAPIPFKAIALVLTVIECCIDEWSTGICTESSWKEVHYKANYLSHLNSLLHLNSHGPDQEGRDLLRRIQDDLLKAARIHAGAPPLPTTGSGKLSINALDAAIRDDHPPRTT